MDFYGLFGEKLAHSLSPQIHRHIFSILGIEGAYKLFPVPPEQLQYAGQAMRTLTVRGANVTIPYKEAIMPQLDEISPEARKIGAVNTILLKEGRLYGYNSDYYGFGRLLGAAGMNPKGGAAVILGNGGAARAAIAYLLDAGVSRLCLVSRDPSRHRQLPRGVELIDYQALERIEGQLLVNATPVGMYPKMGVSPVGEEIVSHFQDLADMIYNPTETEFLRLGRRLGRRTVGGLYMLVGQAIRSQEIWQGREIGDEVLRQVYDRMVREFIRTGAEKAAEVENG